MDCRFVVLFFAFLLSVQGERIADQKCIQYRKVVEGEKRLIPLLVKPKPFLFNTYKCDQAVNLIIGGEDAKRNEFPHHALIGWPSENRHRLSRLRYAFLCGGSLISDRFVLTAAHCGYLGTMGGKPTVVRLGELNLQDGDDDDDHVDFYIEAFIKHPQFKYKLAYHDIALVKLEQNVILSQVIRPACLWTGKALNFTTAIATGFGFTENAGEMATILQKVSLRFVSNGVCDGFFKGVRRFPHGMTDSQYCMAAPKGDRKDTCQGDSGGPIQVVTNSKGCTWHVVAVTSIGGYCGAPDSAAVYTKVASYIDWIETVVWRSANK